MSDQPLVPPAELVCPRCGAGMTQADVATGCTACGGGATQPPPAIPQRDMPLLSGALPPLEETTAEPEPDYGSCSCGGSYDADGWCTTCGSRQADPRHHVELAPSSWVAGVCDRGVKHAGNEDALAVSVVGQRAALVVCDGVSSAVRAAETSQAAADAALTVLASATGQGLGLAASREAAVRARLLAAGDEAATAVEAITKDVQHSSAMESLPSCTLVAAVIDGDSVMVGSVGDSRAYWFPDGADGHLVTVDDSWAEEEIRRGVSRAEAESGPHAHTITRWIGAHSPDHSPRTHVVDVSGPGWLMLCSDGLWNYASEPADLGKVLRDVASDSPLSTAKALVGWAIDQGGHDNITVVLARLGEPSPGDDAAAVGQDEHHA